MATQRRSAFSVYSEISQLEEKNVINGDKAEEHVNNKKLNGTASLNGNQNKKPVNENNNKKQDNSKSKNNRQVQNSVKKSKNLKAKQEPLKGTLNKAENKITKKVNNKKNRRNKKKKRVDENEGELLFEKFLSNGSNDNEEDIVMYDNGDDHYHDDHEETGCDDEECGGCHLQMLPPYNSRDEAQALLAYILHPTKPEEFFKKFWEKKPLLIKRKNPDYFKEWFSCKEFHKILKQKHLDFTQNVDVTTYINGVKEKHNPEGRAYAPLVWDFFQQGCSVRLLNPQTYSNTIWKYLSLLQEIFYTSVGSNIYLTPAGCQGFAPHYDDIEAFALQLEGKKRWRVYNPLNENETLPCVSSRNFNQDEIGQPIIDCILEPGDLLYFPRGFVHQAIACDDIHSLHITVSCYQNNTYGHFLNKLLPAAVEVAMQEDKEFREGLPIGYANYGGVASNEVKGRKKFIEKIVNLAEKLVQEYLPIDAAIDQTAKSFLFDSLPPHLEKLEEMLSIHGSGEKWNAKKNRVDCLTEISPDTRVKFIRKDSVRLVVENNSCRLYYNLENSRIYQEKEAEFLEVDEDSVPSIILLLKKHPEYTSVEDLPLETIDEKITVASCLYDKGLLMTEVPLEYEFDGS